MQITFFTKQVLRNGSIGKLHFTVLLCALQKELCSGTLCDTRLQTFQLVKQKRVTSYMHSSVRMIIVNKCVHFLWGTWKWLKIHFKLRTNVNFLACPCCSHSLQSLLLVPTVPNMGTRSQFTKLICIIIYESETLAVHSVIWLSLW